MLRGRQLDRRAVRDPAHAAPGEQPERRAARLGPVTVFEHGAVEPDPFFRIVRGAASVQLGRCQKEGLAECGIPVRLPGPGAERKQRGSEYEVAKRNVGRLHFSAGCRAAAVARCSAVTSHGKSDVQKIVSPEIFPWRMISHSSRESDGFRSGPGRTQERNAQKNRQRNPKVRRRSFEPPNANEHRTARSGLSTARSRGGASVRRPARPGEC